MSQATASAPAVAPREDARRGVVSKAVSGVIGRLVILVPYLWLLFFFLVPFIIVFKISLSQTAIAMPPYAPTLDT